MLTDIAPAPANVILRRWKPGPAVLVSVGLHGAAVPWLTVEPAAWPSVLALLAINHAVLGGFGMMPRSRMLGCNHVRLPSANAALRQVALTFDDGPDPEITPRVLDILDRSGARASFFCIGRRAAAHPVLLRHIVGRGHSVENHTNTHPNGFPLWPPRMLRREIETAQAVLCDFAGQAPRFFRPPAGLRSPLLHPVLTALSLEYTSWTRRGLDGVSRAPGAVLRRLSRGLAAGDILLLHDGTRSGNAGPPAVLKVLPDLLDQLTRMGLQSVSLPMAFGLTGA